MQGIREGAVFLTPSACNLSGSAAYHSMPDWITSEISAHTAHLARHQQLSLLSEAASALLVASDTPPPVLARSLCQTDCTSRKVPNKYGTGTEGCLFVDVPAPTRDALSAVYTSGQRSTDIAQSIAAMYIELSGRASGRSSDHKLQSHTEICSNCFIAKYFRLDNCNTSSPT